MVSIPYFAYGSNMLTERLRVRCKSASVRSIATIDGYCLAFSKKSQDGSGKATIYPSLDKEGRVYGVVFDLNETDLRLLNEAEGVGSGYDRIENFQIHANTPDRTVDVVTYIASPGYTDSNLKPYDWYLKLVVAGARQHALPPEYVAMIEATLSMKDPKGDRPSQQEALKLLENIHS